MSHTIETSDRLQACIGAYNKLTGLGYVFINEMEFALDMGALLQKHVDSGNLVKVLQNEK